MPVPGSVPSPRTAALRLAVAALILSSLTACGGGPGSGDSDLGTVAILNQTDQGQAPQTVVQFFMRPAGDPQPGQDLLHAEIEPGGVVIVGQFPPGLYDAEVVLQISANLIFRDLEVRPRLPTNVIVPAAP